jgi:hypothetical protein
MSPANTATSKSSPFGDVVVVRSNLAVKVRCDEELHGGTIVPVAAGGKDLRTDPDEKPTTPETKSRGAKAETWRVSTLRDELREHRAIST